jgi:hypothetical protein
MQYVDLEVESNIMASQKLKGKFERKKPSIDPPSYSNTKMENMANDQGIKFCSNFKVLGMR